MQLFAIFAAATTLIAGSNALFIPRDTHVADFRLFSADGCLDGNLGVWTVLSSDFTNGECKGLNDSTPSSLSLLDINNGCTFTAYTDTQCTEGKTDLTTGQCFDTTTLPWKAWSVSCN